MKEHWFFWLRIASSGIKATVSSSGSLAVSSLLMFWNFQERFHWPYILALSLDFTNLGCSTLDYRYSKWYPQANVRSNEVFLRTSSWYHMGRNHVCYVLFKSTTAQLFKPWMSMIKMIGCAWVLAFMTLILPGWIYPMMSRTEAACKTSYCHAVVWQRFCDVFSFYRVGGNSESENIML